MFVRLTPVDTGSPQPAVDKPAWWLFETFEAWRLSKWPACSSIWSIERWRVPFSCLHSSSWIVQNLSDAFYGVFYVYFHVLFYDLLSLKRLQSGWIGSGMGAPGWGPALQETSSQTTGLSPVDSKTWLSQKAHWWRLMSLSTRLSVSQRVSKCWRMAGPPAKPLIAQKRLRASVQRP